MSKIIDFDKYIKERRSLSPSFTLFGENYKLPPTIPYQAMLFIQGKYLNGSNSMKDDDELYFFELLFGTRDIVDKWVQNPEFDMDLISKLTDSILDLYRDIDPKLKMMKVSQEKVE